MPITKFICPDKEEREINQCLNKCPRPEGRCLSLPTLIAIAKQRIWTGTPSTTQLLNGTRLSYLQITQNYSVNPFDQAFSLLGSKHHHKFEVIAKKFNMIAEEKLEGEVTGIFDLLVPDETTVPTEAYELWDYKTSGSFKVAKALGLVSKKAPDPSGAVYQKSGNWGKAGSPKMINIFTQDPTAIDMWDWELQLNHYRIKIEALGFPISKMLIQVTVRDGGTIVAENRGINENIVVIPVKRLDDTAVLGYFHAKREALLSALESKQLPPPCNAEEAWTSPTGQRRRCESFCDVWQFCDVGSAVYGGKK